MLMITHETLCSLSNHTNLLAIDYFLPSIKFDKEKENLYWQLYSRKDSIVMHIYGLHDICCVKGANYAYLWITR
jgi:hypothetical protein